MPAVAILDAWTVVSTSTATPGSKTVSAGSNRVLFYKTILRDGTPQEVLTATFGGQAMTRILQAETNAAGNDVHAAFFMLDEAGIQAASGTAFAITRELANGIRYRASAAVYQNVDQTSPIVDSYAAIGEGGVDPSAEAIDTVQLGFVVASLSGADSVPSGQDATWSNMTQVIEDGDNVHYENIAHVSVSAGTFTPAFTLINNGNAVHLALSLRATKQTIAVGQALESDSAQTIAPVKRRTLGLASETDTADAITPRKQVAVGTATELDTAQAFGVVQLPVAAILQAWSTIATSAASAAAGVAYAVGAGTSRLLMVAIGEESTSHEPTAVVYGGQAMTQVAFAQSAGTFKSSASLWRLNDAGIAAAVGTSVVVTFDGAHDGQLRMFAAVYDNVDQTTPIVDTHSDDAENVNPDPAVLDTSGRASAVAFVANDTAGIDVTWSGVGVAELIEVVASASYYSIAGAFTHGPTLTIQPAASFGRVSYVAASLKGIGQTVAVGQASETDSAFSVLDSLPPVRIMDVWQLVSSSTLDPGQRSVTAGANRLLVYKTAIRDGAGQTVTAVTFGGQAMELVTTAVSNGDGAEIHSSWWILDEAGIQLATTNEWEITRSTADGVVFRAHSASYQGVEQIDPIVDAFSAIGNSGVDPTSEAIDTVAGGVVVAAVSGADQVGGTQDATWSNLTEQVETAAAAIYESIARALVTGVAFTPSYTLVNNGNAILSAISLRAAGSGIPVETAAEIDEAQEITHSRIRSFGQASETDSAQTIRPARLHPVGQAAEIDTAQNFIPRKGVSVDVGLAVETDSAQEITVFRPGLHEFAQASETDSAGEIRPARARTLGLASETDSTFAMGHAKRVQLIQASENDDALSIVVQGLAEEIAAAKRKDGGGGSASRRAALQQAEARTARQAMLRNEDEELMAIIPAIAAAVLGSGRQ